MRLCFGALGRVLKHCKLRANSQNKLVSVLLRSVDKNCRIDDGKDWDNAVNLLLNCTTGLPNGSEAQGAVANKSTSKPGDSLGRVIANAQKADSQVVAAYFASEVIPLLDPNMVKLAILAITDVIKQDAVIDPDTIIDVIGNKNSGQLKVQSNFVAADFFASVFLYTALSVDNKLGKDAVSEITEEFVLGFESQRENIKLIQTNEIGSDDVLSSVGYVPVNSNSLMMRPDINIAIAYSGEHQTQVAVLLKAKLEAYARAGYPVSVSLVNDEYVRQINDKGANRELDGKTVEIAEQMENLFSDFDCAVFLFDTNGKAIPDNGSESDLLSSNLIYEYGLASSAFINRTLDSEIGGKRTRMNKRIYCFAPKEISGDSLKYIHGIEMKVYKDTFPAEYQDSADKQSSYILGHYIHTEVVCPNFYGMSTELPVLDENYALKETLTLHNPMELSPTNYYWPNLRKLSIGGVRVTLDTDAVALNTAFEREYQNFDKAESQYADSEHVLARRIMYIVERAVFIMYLRCDDKWSAVVDDLHSKRILSFANITEIEAKTVKIDDDYYLQALKTLKGVFDYQSLTRKKTLSQAKNLEEIIAKLQPIVDRGNEIGNRMLFSLACDYMALCYHKIAYRELKSAIGVELYMDNYKHHILLQEYLKGTPSTGLLAIIKQNLRKAAELFDMVVTTEATMTDDYHTPNGKYIWTSFALYNKSRCDFLLHLFDSVLQSEDVSQNDWNSEMLNSVFTRRDDYCTFKDIANFPHILKFNLKAEFYHAAFEYELSCEVDAFYNVQGGTTNADSKDFNQKETGFNDWKGRNLIISDVLDVAAKVGRIKKLKDDIEKGDATKDDGDK